MKANFFQLNLLENLPSDPLEALNVLCGEFSKFDTAGRGLSEYHEDYLEAYSILNAFAQHKNLDYVPMVNPSSASLQSNIRAIQKCFNDLTNEVGNRLSVRRAQGHFTSKRDHYTAIFSGLTAYEFSDADYEKIQNLINELRVLIVKNETLSESHRARLLKRLEAMQSELHKKTSDIDRFWGFIGEAGVNAKKFGEDIKPITDRVRELGAIVVAVIFAKEGIPLPPESLKLLLPDK